MSDDKTGGQAYPSMGSIAHNSEWLTEEGMTLRDYFAGQALAGLCGNAGSAQTRWHDVAAGMARASYNMADAMIEARGGGK